MKNLPEINDEHAVLTLLDLLQPSFEKMMEHFGFKAAFILVQSGDRTYAPKDEKHIIQTWAKRLVFLPLSFFSKGEYEALAINISTRAIHTECDWTDHGSGDGQACGATVVAPFSSSPHWIVTVISTQVVMCEMFASMILKLLMAAEKQRIHNNDPMEAMLPGH